MFSKIYHRNRVKGPPKEIDTGAGFFLEEEENKKAQEVKVTFPEGRVAP